jgi:hypothetical protein
MRLTRIAAPGADRKMGSGIFIFGGRGVRQGSENINIPDLTPCQRRRTPLTGILRNLHCVESVLDYFNVFRFLYIEEADENRGETEQHDSSRFSLYVDDLIPKIGK